VWTATPRSRSGGNAREQTPGARERLQNPPPERILQVDTPLL
jgi:hypothetical protein